MAYSRVHHCCIQLIQNWCTVAGGQRHCVAGTGQATMAEQTAYIASMAAASAVRLGATG